MSMHSIVASDEPTKQIEDRRTAALRRMSAEQFRSLGIRQVAYVRSAMCDGEVRFLLHGADGMVLAVVDEAEAAVEMAVDQGLEFIAVH